MAKKQVGIIEAIKDENAVVLIKQVDKANISKAFDDYKKEVEVHNAAEQEKVAKDSKYVPDLWLTKIRAYVTVTSEDEKK